LFGTNGKNTRRRGRRRATTTTSSCESVRPAPPYRASSPRAGYSDLDSDSDLAWFGLPIRTRLQLQYIPSEIRKFSFSHNMVSTGGDYCRLFRVVRLFWPKAAVATTPTHTVPWLLLARFRALHGRSFSLNFVANSWRLPTGSTVKPPRRDTAQNPLYKSFVRKIKQ